MTPIFDEDDTDNSSTSTSDDSVIQNKVSTIVVPFSTAIKDEAKIAQNTTRILIDSWYNAYRSILNVFNAPRPTSIILAIWFLYMLAIRAEVLLPQYTSLVLSWPLATVNRLLALKELVTATMLLSLPTLRKVCLEPRMSTRQIDLLITQVSIIVNTLGFIGLAFSTRADFFIMSLCLYTSGCGLDDSLTAFGVFTLLPGEDVAEFYMRTGLLTTIGSLLGSPLLSLVFNFVLKNPTLPFGLPLLLCAGLLGACVVGVSILRRETAQRL